MIDVLLASANPHKIAEFAPLLGDAPFRLAALPEPVEVEEDAPTFALNASKKAKTCAERFGTPCLADDSGLAIHALGGAPGIFSARWAPSDAERIAKALRELEGKKDRSATFHCALALVWPDGRTVGVEGVVPGRIAHAPRGSNGFGYDPVFELVESGLTYAELTGEQKNQLSHRAVAVRLLIERLKTTP